MNTRIVGSAISWWDLEACIGYGQHELDDHQMHKLLETNYPLREFKQLSAGIILNIPDLPPTPKKALVPWS
jgi:hypothetical protein